MTERIEVLKADLNRKSKAVTKELGSAKVSDSGEQTLLFCLNLKYVCWVSTASMKSMLENAVEKRDAAQFQVNQSQTLIKFFTDAIQVSVFAIMFDVSFDHDVKECE